MRVISNSSRLVFGRTVVERLVGMSPPADLQSFIAAFEQEQTKYETASEATEKAEERRDDVLAAIGRADGKLDLAVEDLAVSLINARKGNRKSPLAKYSNYSVSRLANLAYAKEVEEVEQIAAKIAKDEPTEQISAAVAACLQHAASVKSALSDLSVPEADYQRKLAARDAIVPDWERAYARLELRASVAWEDEPEAVQAIFARPERVQQPVTRRGKKKGASKTDEPAKS